MNRTRKSLFILLMLVTAIRVAQAHDTGLNECAQIAGALDRLDCYDALARDAGQAAASPAPAVRAAPAAPAAAPRQRQPVAPAATVSTPSTPAQPAPRQRQPAAPAATVSTPATPAQPAPAAAPQGKNAAFGFENRAFETGPEIIQSHYDGIFTGWSGKTLFQLENGQVWKQSQSGRVAYRRDRPLITIKKAAFGSFRLKVEGLNKSVRVKRVK